MGDVNTQRAIGKPSVRLYGLNAFLCFKRFGKYGAAFQEFSLAFVSAEKISRYNDVTGLTPSWVRLEGRYVPNMRHCTFEDGGKREVA
jgi:hypothetical protein